MKRSLILLILAVAACFGAKEHRILASYGARYIYRGHSAWTMIWHFWGNKVFPFTVDPATDVVTATGHTYVAGDSVYLSSTGALPSGSTNKRQYWVCDISGDTFKLATAGSYTCAQSYRVDFTDTGSGTHKAGEEQPSGVSGGHVTLSSLSGVPSGVTYEVWCEHQLCPTTSGKPYSYAGASYFLFRFTADSTATLGLATITATLSVEGEDDESVQFPLTVETLTPIASTRPANYPSIPNLKTWESTMSTMARTWCDPTSYATAASSIGTLGAGVESQVWYYDGTWVYRQIARYTGNANWNNCADYIGNWYRDYVLVNNGGILGHRAFTDGLKSSCASCDMRNRHAISRLSVAQGGTLTGGWPWDWRIRETAYALETHMAYQAMTGKPYVYLGQQMIVREAGHLLAAFDELFRDGTWTYQQIYWNGLAMRALIRYFELTGDQRVPVYIKKALDWMWTNAWNDTTKLMVYNPANYGPQCDYGCADTDGWTWTELIGLTLPAAGWYYWYSGDDTYRQRGDEWFKALPRWPEFTGTASNDYITVTAHGLSVDDEVQVRRHPNGSGLPGGLTNLWTGYVKSVVDANTITVSATKGGATKDLTSDGVGMLGLKCGPVTYCRGRDSGKMFSQQFRWGIAYVQWRQGQTPYAP